MGVRSRRSLQGPPPEHRQHRRLPHFRPFTPWLTPGGGGPGQAPPGFPFGRRVFPGCMAAATGPPRCCPQPRALCARRCLTSRARLHSRGFDVALLCGRERACCPAPVRVLAKAARAWASRCPSPRPFGGQTPWPLRACPGASLSGPQLGAQAWGSAGWPGAVATFAPLPQPPGLLRAGGPLEPHLAVQPQPTHPKGVGAHLAASPPAPCPEHRGGSSRVSPRRGCGRRTGCLLLATRYAVCFLAFWRPGPWGLPSTPSTALQPRRTAPQPCAWRPVGLWGGLSPAAQPPSRLGEGAAPLRGEQKATNPLVLAKIISENIFCFMWENRYQSHGMLYFILVVFENILIFGNTKINNGVCCTWCGPRVLSGGRALPGLSRCRPRVSPRRGPSLGPRRGHHRKFLQCPFVSPAA